MTEIKATAVNDNFFDEDFEKEESLEEILNTPVKEDEPISVDDEERPDWKLTAEEEKVLERLLEKKKKEDFVMETFLKLESKPSEKEIELWKKQFGNVYFVSLGEKENFIFRAIKRLEWRQLMAQIAKLPEDKKVDAIAMKGTVWPKLTDANVAVLSAGTTEGLKNLILEASNFMEPERAMRLVRQL